VLERVPVPALLPWLRSALAVRLAAAEAARS
jgi:hypothetical protein